AGAVYNSRLIVAENGGTLGARVCGRCGRLIGRPRAAGYRTRRIAVHAPRATATLEPRGGHMEPFEDKVRRGGAAALEEVGRFFMKEDPVHKALRSIAARLADLGISYAVAGGMALVSHGYRRTTEDVDIVVSAEGLT